MRARFSGLAAVTILAGCMSGGGLVLEREGSFFVNGRNVETKYPGASRADVLQKWIAENVQ